MCTTVSRISLLTVLMLTGIVPGVVHASPHWVANGGDALDCGSWGGWRFLDSIVADLARIERAGESLETSFEWTQKRLILVSPALTENWLDFYRSWAEKSAHHSGGNEIRWIWRPTVFTPHENPLKDEDLTSEERALIPETCSTVQQAFIQTRRMGHSGEQISFWFDPGIVSALEDRNSELSWALVHEWLWTAISEPTPRRIRAVNSLIHSDLWIQADPEILSWEWTRRSRN